VTIFLTGETFIFSSFSSHSDNINKNGQQVLGVSFFMEVSMQGVSKIRVLILTSEGARQFMKLFSITFCKIRKNIPRFFAPQFLPNESLCVIN
jgi:hypothetical protein